MYRIKEISQEVEKYRDYLQKLMEDKKEYTGEEILCASRMLDILINEYNSILKSRGEKENTYSTVIQLNTCIPRPWPN